ncbi:mitochondrial carrier [Polychaeton citri CBS 116435]|uniref:Mitochondrial carrier n=1 Tax=Polychaeton citri CBS 116435 TaxID=1314669 RepID=A0A9P4USF2_9PEZI|nr:mitochondrial carrier [Polychaeton citri CBS 116435]
MVLARVADYLFPQSNASSGQLNYLDNEPRPGSYGSVAASQQDARRKEEVLHSDTLRSVAQSSQLASSTDEQDDMDAYRPQYLHAMLAGGVGGTTGDMLMHSLDTVKTRQQGDPHMPPKYSSMGNTYYTIWRQEGITKGLYGGVLPAFLGSFGGTLMFFGCYEWSKRFMIDHGVNPAVSYFSAGWVADLAASPLYVPTEVLKTRLQLQGRYNNPYFQSGYNYRGTLHALRTIARTEGVAELFSGYKATLSRDLPFSALQFAFYEQEQKMAKAYVGPGNDIGLILEILTGASAGGMAGVITCPLDVVKTRIQTELDPEIVAMARSKSASASRQGPAHPTPSSTQQTHRPTPHNNPPSQPPASKLHSHAISTSSPSTSLKHHGQVNLDTESVFKALKIIYRTEGVAGWFRGVGPRGVWTSIQSGTMLLVYQKLLKWFDSHPLTSSDDVRGYSN